MQFLSSQRSFLWESDPAIAECFEKESRRLQNGIELIASENVVSPAVLAAMSSVFVNKYAEGYPGKRYYGGCEVVDIAESIAIDRLKNIFGSKFANVQPHSGAQANQAVYLAFLQPGDCILGMNLSHGGHLTHGSPVNSSGKLYKSEFYGVDEKTGLLDYDNIREIAKKVKPKMIVAGASAYARTVRFDLFRQIADEVGALLLVDMAHIAGLVATGMHMSPVPHAHIVTATTHKTLRGPRGGIILTNDENHAKLIDKAVFPGTQGGPLMHIIAAKAVAFGEVLKPEFKEYGQRIVQNAQVLSQTLLAKNIKLVTGGTDNHLMLLDLRETPWSGKDVEERLAKIEITVNKNTVPGETRKPMVTSGVRIGTPAVTTRGMGSDEMRELGAIIAECVSRTNDQLDDLKDRIHKLTKKFPLYDGSIEKRGFLANS